MRIAMLTSLNGGVGTFVVNLCKELATFPDIQLIDIYGYSDYKHVPLSFPDEVSVRVHVNNPYLFMPRMAFMAYHLRNYDIVHINHARFFGLLYLMTWFRRVPCVYTTVFNPVDEMSNASFFRKCILKFEERCIGFASKRVDLHLAVSDYCRRTMQENMGVVPQAVIYHGIDAERYAHCGHKRENIRSQRGIEDNETLLLYVGMLEKHKSVITMIDAMAHLQKRAIGTSVKLLIIGRGPSYKELADRVKQLNLETVVDIHTEVVEDINAYYSAADLFVFPSVGEGFGFVFLEAMACGLPIIAADAGSAPEVLGEAGLLFSPRDSEGLAERISELLSHPQLHDELRKRGLERVQQFTWEKAAAQYYEVYSSVLQEKKTPSRDSSILFC